GIGPTYMDKTGRNGLRVGDIEASDFKNRYKALTDKHKQMLGFYNHAYDIEQLEAAWFEGVELLKTFTLIDSEYSMDKYLNQGKKILAEGAQGSLLDIDFGSYPFVTSSNTITAGTCTGLGIAPSRIGEVFGIFKAYCTRVGSGPFPTELNDETGENMRVKGNEFGSTTGRPRRTGWLDLPALRYAIMLNGVTQLCMMKSDVLSGFDQLKVCTAYDVDGQIIKHIPFDVIHANMQPVYETLPGWQDDLTSITQAGQLPQALQHYIQFIENELKVPVKIVSVGPNRLQTMWR
ncbi:MAG TPA: adenylosuccinate synthetase, partial [Bacteroidia bacterium]|nr:adenylosuccinate synthetase [Bacteroidia bacterium]